MPKVGKQPTMPAQATPNEGYLHQQNARLGLEQPMNISSGLQSTFSFPPLQDKQVRGPQFTSPSLYNLILPAPESWRLHFLLASLYMLLLGIFLSLL